MINKKNNARKIEDKRLNCKSRNFRAEGTKYLNNPYYTFRIFRLIKRPSNSKETREREREREREKERKKNQQKQEENERKSRREENSGTNGTETKRD